MNPKLVNLGLRARTKYVYDQVKILAIRFHINARNEHHGAETSYATACLLRFEGDILARERRRRFWPSIRRERLPDCTGEVLPGALRPNICVRRFFSASRELSTRAPPPQKLTSEHRLRFFRITSRAARGPSARGFRIFFFPKSPPKILSRTHLETSFFS